MFVYRRVYIYYIIYGHLYGSIGIYDHHWRNCTVTGWWFQTIIILLIMITIMIIKNNTHTHIYIYLLFLKIHFFQKTWLGEMPDIFLGWIRTTNQIRIHDGMENHPMNCRWICGKSRWQFPNIITYVWTFFAWSWLFPIGSMVLVYILTFFWVYWWDPCYHI